MRIMITLTLFLSLISKITSALAVLLFSPRSPQSEWGRISWCQWSALLHRVSCRPGCGSISCPAGPVADSVGLWRGQTPPQTYQQWQRYSHQIWPDLNIVLFWNVQTLFLDRDRANQGNKRHRSGVLYGSVRFARPCHQQTLSSHCIVRLCIPFSLVSLLSCSLSSQFFL